MGREAVAMLRRRGRWTGKVLGGGVGGLERY
jgi:hypothetical protein